MVRAESFSIEGDWVEFKDKSEEVIHVIKNWLEIYKLTPAQTLITEEENTENIKKALDKCLKKLS